MTILEKILEEKKQEVAARKEAIPIEHLKSLATTLPTGRSLKQALLDSDTGIISEFKRKSPSKGYIHENAEVSPVVSGYQQGGCSGVSVLTDYPFFGGTIRDFKQARAHLQCPLLRKDFMIDAYQVYEAKVLGADVILLIASALTPDEVYDLGELAHALGMETLLEVHNEKELDYINRFTDLVGVNNRNLSTFVTDVNVSLELASKIPDRYVKVSESGISDPQTVLRLREAGYQGFLMGENFMKQSNPGTALSEFVQALKV